MSRPGAGAPWRPFKSHTVKEPSGEVTFYYSPHWGRPEGLGIRAFTDDYFLLASRVVKPHQRARTENRVAPITYFVMFPEGGPVRFEGSGRRLLVHPDQYGIFPGMGHMETVPQAFTTHRMTFVVDRPFLKEVWEEVFGPSSREPVLAEGAFPRTATLRTLLRLLFRESTRRDVSPWLSPNALARQLLLWLFLHHPHDLHALTVGPVLQPVNDRLVADALDDLRVHHAEDGSVEEVARRLGVSYEVLNRRLKAALGLTAQEYLQRYRIERAKALLQQRELTISQICQEVGYANASHFTRLFRLQTGMTPRAYRLTETKHKKPEAR